MAMGLISNLFVTNFSNNNKFKNVLFNYAKLISMYMYIYILLQQLWIIFKLLFTGGIYRSYNVNDMLYF